MHSPDEERRSRRIRMPRRWWTRLTLGGLVLAALLAPAAWANHQFTDVPTASPHHADISAIASVGITGGCAPGLYCPGQAVTRDQMASFIRRGLPRTGASGTTADLLLTNNYQTLASDSITAGGTAGGSGFVVVIAHFTALSTFSSLLKNHRILFKVVQGTTNFESNESSATLYHNTLEGAPSTTVSKMWLFTQPTGTTRTYSLQARVVFPVGAELKTVNASSRLIQVIYVPFGPTGTSSPLGSLGATGGSQAVDAAG